MDKTLPLFARYRAMFALRNVGTPEAVDALASGFADDSALFKCAFFGDGIVPTINISAGTKLLSFLANSCLPTPFLRF